MIGASGFIGRSLTALLRDRGARVLAYASRPVETPPVPGVTWRSWNAVHDPLAFDERVDAVYYLSQSPHYRRFTERPAHVLGVNTVGPARAARAATEAGARLFCFASTGSVYQPSFEPIPETAPLKRTDGYVVSKLAGEDAVGLFAGEMQITSARIFGAYGPGQKGMMVPRLAESVAEGRPVTLAPGRDGENDGGFRISLTYVDDLARGLVELGALATAGEDLPSVVNLAGPNAVDIRGIARSIGHILDRDPVVERTDTPRPGDLVADTTLLSGLVDVDFTPIEVGLERTFRHTARKSA